MPATVLQLRPYCLTAYVDTSDTASFGSLVIRPWMGDDIVIPCADLCCAKALSDQRRKAIRTIERVCPTPPHRTIERFVDAVMNTLV